MKNTSRNDNRFRRPADPDDLRQLLTPRELAGLALAAVQTLDWTIPPRVTPGRTSAQPRMMLTLLGYCYASGIYGSNHVVQALQDDPTVRYLCAHQYPDATSIRLFRRDNRARLEQCLACILEKARARAHAATLPWAKPCLLPVRSSRSARAEPHDRIETACFIDMIEQED